MAKKAIPQPKHDRVLIKPAPAEERTSGGIIIPDTAKEKPQKGTVIQVGPGKHAELTGNLIPMSVKIGDVVYYGKYAGSEIELEGETYIVMRDSDIIL